jgi:SAM-dependent methyltransferase
MNVNRTSPTDNVYYLGHGDAQIRRLLLQGRVHDTFTEHASLPAGLAPGMQVLDVGCRPGDVSFVAARAGRPGRRCWEWTGPRKPPRSPAAASAIEA